MAPRERTGSDQKGAEPSLCSLGNGLWFVKRLFHLGEGQKDGLTYEGLKERLLTALGDDPLSHPALQPYVAEQESSPTQLRLEREAVLKLQTEDLPFILDTTMTVVRSAGQYGEPVVTIISPVQFDSALKDEIEEIGPVTRIIVPSLQHWIFTEPWAEAYPNAKIYWATPALGEDLVDKLPHLTSRSVFLQDGTGQLGSDLEVKLLRGAPLNMNEFVFYHSPSQTLIASDAFYGGYSKDSETSWFQRLWFKLTKGGSYTCARLPIYRTSRVKTDGSKEDLLACVDEIANWNFENIVFAHGTVPFTGPDAPEAFRKAWTEGLE